MTTILLVEDDDQLGALMHLLLTRNGYRVLLGRSLREARAIWAEHSLEIALMITDEKLPDGSGVVLAEQLSENNPVKVIVASGNPEPSNKNGFVILQKPFLMKVLLETVRGTIGQGETEAPSPQS